MTAVSEPDPLGLDVPAPGVVVRPRRVDGEFAELEMRGELDASTVSSARSQLAAGIKPGVREVVIDVADLEFCDARGVGLFVELQERCAAGPGSLHLRAPSRALQRLLAIVDLGYLVGENGSK